MDIEKDYNEQAEHILENIMQRERWGCGVRDEISDYLKSFHRKHRGDGLTRKLNLCVVEHNGSVVYSKKVAAKEVIEALHREKTSVGVLITKKEKKPRKPRKQKAGGANG